LNIIKHFYLKYPQYKWVSFKDMKGMSRDEFADTLKECCLAVWIDKIAGFGTFPIEAAKCGVPVIGLIPEIVPEFATDKSGIWTNDFLAIPDLIGNYIRLWLEDAVPDQMKEGTVELSEKYSEKDGIEEINRTFKEYISERKEEFEKFLRENQVISQPLLEEVTE
jgi:glycosyltransferase involved in cell wall biosynthesis